MNRIISFVTVSMLLLCLTAGAAADAFDFSLPKGFFVPQETATEHECTIVCRNVGRVGGFCITELEPSALSDYSGVGIIAYLQSEVPEGYGLDYIMDFGRTVTASAIWVNQETMEIREFKHRFFDREGTVYDFWFDVRYLNGQDEVDFLIETDIEPESIYVDLSEPITPDLRLALPTGYSMVPKGNGQCMILADGEAVGALALTGISPEILADFTDDSFWDILTEAEENPYYAEDTACEFAVHRFLAKSLKESCYDEYIMMHWTLDDGSPMTDVSYAVTDEATGERTETSHTFFVRGNAVYDLWFILEAKPDGSMLQLLTLPED